MKKLLKISALALSVGLGGVAAQAESIKWGDYMPQGVNEYARTAEWMSKQISERSGGKHSLKMLWGGTVATVGEVPTAVENGSIETGPVVTPYFPDQFVINNAIPFFWPQPKNQAELGALMLKWHDEIPAFGEELAKYNLKLLSIRPLAAYGIICTKPVRSIADFKGLRVRSYGIALPAMLEAVGAVPVSLSDIGAYEAMSKGVIDCSPGDPPLSHGYKLDEIAKYFIDVPMGASWGHIMVINTDAYNSLPADFKTIIDDMKDDYLAEFLTVYSKAVKDVRAGWNSSDDVEIIKFPKDAFLEATLGNARVQEVQASWAKRAVAAGMSEADAAKVVADIKN